MYFGHFQRFQGNFDYFRDSMVFWSFEKFSGLLRSFWGHFDIFEDFWIFWTFMVHSSHLGSSKWAILEILVYLSVFFYIFVILTVKINFF